MTCVYAQIVYGMVRLASRVSTGVPVTTPTPLAERLAWCAECGQYTARTKVTLCACGVTTERTCTRDPQHRTGAES
jgi:hypothetical protein